jgi:hypothetical protein
VSKGSVNQVVQEAMAPPDLAKVLDGLVKFIQRFLVLETVQLYALALWIAHTYVFERGYVTPYLQIHSAVKRSGKSRVLEVLEVLVKNAWSTGKSTVAALIRSVDKYKPTLLADETDAALNASREYAETLRGILNDGFKSTGRYRMCVPPSNDVKDFSTYCPKAFALIGKLPDTVSDRSIPITMKRKPPLTKVERWRSGRSWPEAQELVDHLGRWAQGTECFDDEVPLPDELDDRAQDIWEILLQIADEAGDEWPGRARKAALILSAGREDDDDSLGVRLLADIHAVLRTKGVDHISSTQLVSALKNIEEATWAELDGKALTPNKMAALLRPFDIRPTTYRMGADKKPTKGYARSDFDDAWSRYTPSLSGNTVTESSQAHNDHANGVTEQSHDTPTDPSLLPIGQTPSSAWPSGGEPVVTDVTDREEVHRF